MDNPMSVNVVSSLCHSRDAIHYGIEVSPGHVKQAFSFRSIPPVIHRTLNVTPAFGLSFSGIVALPQYGLTGH